MVFSIADLSSVTHIAVLVRKSRGTFVKKVFSRWVCVDDVVLVRDHLDPRKPIAASLRVLSRLRFSTSAVINLASTAQVSLKSTLRISAG